MKALPGVLALVLWIGIAAATIPPKNGGPLPDYVKAEARWMDAHLSEGNLARWIRSWAQQKQDFLKSGAPETRTTMVLNVPVVMGKYADATNYIADAPEQMQKELFDGPWPSLTMREFYLENSYGQFELTGTVYGWVNVSGPEANYAPNNARTFIREVLDSLDNSVDFSQFDNDGDGYVEGIIVVHSSAGAEYGGGGTRIWSHRSKLSYVGGPYITNDFNGNGIQVKIDDYTIQGSRTPGGTLERIGVFCHEFGHILGLPDLYDRDGSSGGIGEWGLMGGGSWNLPESPSQFCAWSKEVLGWLTPVLVEEDMQLVNIPPVESQPVVYKLWDQGNVSPWISAYGAGLNVGKQYFLLENRQKSGSDQYLNGTGLLIWHIDNSVLSQNDDETHKLVDLEEADGLAQIDLNQSQGDDGDPFPGSTNNTVFDYNSNPNSRSYNNGDTRVAVKNILEDDTDIYADLGVGLVKYAFTGLNFDDASANGIMEPGETVNFWFQIRNNTTSTAQNLTVDVSAASPLLSVQNSSVNLGDLPAGASTNNALNPVLITIDANAPAQTVPLDVRISHSGGYEKIIPMDFVIGVPEFLIIDKDGSGFYSGYYRDWLESNNYPFQVVGDSSQIFNKRRFQQRNVIAVLGGRNENALTDADLQDSLTVFLSGAGKGLLVIAPQGAAAISNTPFSQDVLHVNYVGSTTNILLRGLAGDPLGFNGSFVFLEGGATREMVQPLDGATASIFFNGTNYGGLIHYEDGANNKTVYVSFGLRDILSTSIVKADQILTELMNWFALPTAINVLQNPALPERFALEQNYPNPFNPTTTINFSIPVASRVSLVVYNSLGQKVAVLINENLASGSYTAKWDAAKLPSGIYFYRLTAENSSAGQHFVRTRKMILMQ